MAINKIVRFSKVFSIEQHQVEFDFNPMNAKDPQLYQVYFMYGPKRVRFHMQINGEGQFVITDKNRCPDKCNALESEFSQAILESIRLS
jgi:hypothetical protein